MNHKPVCRAAPATPGLLNIGQYFKREPRNIYASVSQLSNDAMRATDFDNVLIVETLVVAGSQPNRG